MNINKNELRVIEEFSNAKGPSGFEDEVIEIARKELKGICDFKEDKFRNLYIFNKKNNGKKPLVMLDAHSDEVGFMVQSINPNGTINVINLGSLNYSTMPGEKVYIKNALGEWVKGLFVSIPVHYAGSIGDRNLKVTNLAIDLGTSSYLETINNFKIKIGMPIVPASLFEYDHKNDLMFGKAFDCRIGCASLIEVMKRISKLDLDVDIVGVLSSQEEVGERGARVASNNVKADLAICLEGTPCDDTFNTNGVIQTRLKGGPMFRHMDCSAIISPRFLDFALNVCKKNKIAYQEAVRYGGGTNAAVISLSNNGVPTIVAAVPVRYIHAFNCITSYFDYDETTKFTVELLKTLNKKVIDKF